PSTTRQSIKGVKVQNRTPSTKLIFDSLIIIIIKCKIDWISTQANCLPSNILPCIKSQQILHQMISLFTLSFFGFYTIWLYFALIIQDKPPQTGSLHANLVWAFTLLLVTFETLA